MKQLTDVTVILDRSGSMESIASDVIGGFNAFLEAQRQEPGECVLTLVQFDDEYEVVYAGEAIADAPRLTDKTYQPRGSTALLDAIGRTIDAAGKRLAALPEAERPDRVLFVIVTDGMENASSDYTRDHVFEMISRQQDVYKWSFLFLAANQDAIASAATFAILPQQAANFVPTAGGVHEMASMLSEAVVAYRSTGAARLRGKTSEGKKKVH